MGEGGSFYVIYSVQFLIVRQVAPLPLRWTSQVVMHSILLDCQVYISGKPLHLDWWPQFATLHDITWSCVEMSGFEASDVPTCSKSSQFLHTTSTRHNMTPRQVSWFSDFVWILYNLQTLFLLVVRHVTEKDVWNFMWLPRYGLNIHQI
jgi:hypothetical protein